MDYSDFLKLQFKYLCVPSEFFLNWFYIVVINTVEPFRTKEKNREQSNDFGKLQQLANHFFIGVNIFSSLIQ